ncbi:hypothetical protein QN399_18115 [Pseudomonas sp. 10C3]|uniref:hypothetical protein n=1 Tax=Pseudomonas sp. 10C3 TaxID=3118753 RepID=UPI002E80B43A|nr:hypothetical protein [Pseudomonas sp. 10C3]MEE3508156.1 hypothetical protein [Pseudomonas sp. 10C3]
MTTKIIKPMGESNIGKSDITLIQYKGEPRIDSRLLAEQALLLGRIAELALTAPDEAMGMLANDLSPGETHDSLLFLRLAVFDQAASSLLAPKFTEFDIHRKFFTNLDAYLPGAVRLIKKSDPLHIPDGWVKLSGEILPVEVKRDAFTKASARQLARYIEYYGVGKGVAVAASFTCAPDPRFICITHDVTSASDLLPGGAV